MASRLLETDEEPTDTDLKKNVTPSELSLNKLQIVYYLVIFYIYIHVAAFYGLYLGCTSAKWSTMGFGVLMHILGTIGITAGAHRLWSHRSYKAKLPLQIMLMVFNSITSQKTVINWSRDHRVHHKCSDTEGDPHNASRGFFYSHMGWLMTKKSEEVIKQGKVIDVSDLYSNPVIRLQNDYPAPIIGTLCFVLPTVIPMYFWGETFNNAWHLNMLRFVVTLHIICCVNSVAHFWGYKPYDKKLRPCQNPILSSVVLGEGFHNYHHVFPWDYRASELGNKYLNLSTMFIDFFAWVGWAYDLKATSEEIIKNRKERTDDGSDLWGHAD
ncbi:acyl-CoA Delta(11) desaturase-like [Ostrinia furnacalis]|uniref:acyl-CoA Delta(11) desaturase-like n=1 Tax=Ostrinia furnacalis TaxID=93504 RepID=UPI001039A180|nr:acyl-CoA Delta(11) desaturase-like [Ostrinia furnacalis]